MNNASLLLTLLLVASVACNEVPAALVSLGAPTEPPMMAAIRSDYASTAIDLIGSDGRISDPSWINSGTTSPTLVATLSGDVVFPSEMPPGELMLIDRLNTDVVTRIALRDGSILSQERVRVDIADAAAFSPNPQDVACVEGRCWVSRFGRNLATAVDPLAIGNDLWELSADVPTRISMAAADDGVIAARPSKMLAVEGKLVVGLARLADDFESAGAGAIAFVDLSGEVRVLPLGDSSNCGFVARAAAVTQVWVVCEGFDFPRYANVATWQSSAAIHLLDVEEERVLRTFSGDALGFPPASLVATSNGLLVTALAAAFSDGLDRLYRVDETTGDATEFRTGEPFGISVPVVLDGDTWLGTTEFGCPLLIGNPELIETPASSGCESVAGLPMRALAALR